MCILCSAVVPDVADRSSSVASLYIRRWPQVAAADGGLATDQSPKEWPGSGGLTRQKDKVNFKQPL